MFSEINIRCFSYLERGIHLHLKLQPTICSFMYAPFPSSSENYSSFVNHLLINHVFIDFLYLSFSFLSFFLSCLIIGIISFVRSIDRSFVISCYRSFILLFYLFMYAFIHLHVFIYSLYLLFPLFMCIFEWLLFLIHNCFWRAIQTWNW